MDSHTLIWLCACFAVAAALYSSVGHGGASAYLAIMALFSVAPPIMRPTALALNILVAGFGSWRYLRAGRFDWQVFWPVALGALPFAFIGGAIQLPGRTYHLLLGGVLLLVGLRLLLPDLKSRAVPIRPPATPIRVAAGAGIGLLAGLTGTGGGIFLSPLMVVFRWTQVKNITGIASLFIVFNSMAGLAGNVATLKSLPLQLPWLMLAAGAGALLGTWLGVSRYTPQALRMALGIVTLVASFKLLIG